MNLIPINQELVRALHDYLMTRPMGEIEGLVVGIRQSMQSHHAKAAETEAKPGFGG